MMALWRRGRPESLMHHSHRGSQHHQRVLPATAAGSGDHLQHEPIWQRLGQLGGGELFLFSEDAENGPEGPSDSQPSQGRCLRLHRVVLPSDQKAFDPGIPQSRTVLGTRWISLSRCPRNRRSPARQLPSQARLLGDERLSLRFEGDVSQERLGFTAHNVVEHRRRPTWLAFAEIRLNDES
jgi:hypothetical protein